MSQLQARNEEIIRASAARIWSVITDINQLPKVNPGVISASGRMDVLGETRSCVIDNNGKRGTMNERLVELLPLERTTWTIDSDTMGMSKMLKDTRFIFRLEKIDEAQTKLISETHYVPSNMIARIMNVVLMRPMIRKAQAQILNNIKSITE